MAFIQSTISQLPLVISTATHAFAIALGAVDQREHPLISGLPGGLRTIKVISTSMILLLRQMADMYTND